MSFKFFSVTLYVSKEQNTAFFLKKYASSHHKDQKEAPCIPGSFLAFQIVPNFYYFQSRQNYSGFNIDYFLAFQYILSIPSYVTHYTILI